MTDLFRPTGIQRMTSEGNALEADHLAKETLLHLQDHTGTFVSLLGTPSDLQPLFFGHCISEGIRVPKTDALTITTTLEGGYYIQSKEHLVERSETTTTNRIVTTSCGACDAPGLDDLIVGLPLFDGGFQHVDLHVLAKGFEHMKAQQLGFTATGGMHGAALHTATDGIIHLAEDIGRHNAVDKVVGMEWMSEEPALNPILFLSGRCGWDIVAKAARAGIGTIACVGACSTLAADTARALHMRIFSFVKRDTCVAIGRIEASLDGKA